jgi:hypothetical protein
VDLAGDILYSQADMTKVNVMLSYMSVVDPKDPLRRTIIWFREQRLIYQASRLYLYLVDGGIPNAAVPKSYKQQSCN